MAQLHIRLWPTDDPIGEHVVVEARAKVDDLPVQWAHTPLGRAARDGDGWVLSTDLAPDPEDTVREVRQLLGVAKWLALQRPEDWVQVWDDDGMIEATFGVNPSLFAGVATGEDGAYDDALETKMAEAIGKVPLPGLDLGFPPGLDPEVLDALDRGVGERADDPAFVTRLVAAVNRCAKLRRTSAVEFLANLFDSVDAGVLRDTVVAAFPEHQPVVRKELDRLLEFHADRALARRVGLDLLYTSPKGQALDDVARALVPFAEDPELITELTDVVTDDGPPRPGTRVESAAADLLMRTPEGRRAVARRARGDRAAEPMFWWAVRKLLEHPGPDVEPTIQLYAKAAPLPEWFGEAFAAAGLTPSKDGEGELLAREATLLG